MIEREPDFEDDKIRAGTERPEEEFGGVGRDPTMLGLDMERGEIYDIRTYRFRPGSEAMAYLADRVLLHTAT